MLQAMNTGHDGSLTTVHANSSFDALSRVETLAAMSEVEVPFAVLREQVNAAMELVVQLERGADGARRVVEVAYVTSKRREEYALHPILRYDKDRTRSVGASGGFVRWPLPQELVNRLLQNGQNVPEAFRGGTGA
jgi:pilus assembly protein CpaF